MNGRIKLIRKTLGISQRDFGKKIGISDTAVSKLESGERNPSEQTLKSICREFNVDYFWRRCRHVHEITKYADGKIIRTV